MVVAFTFYCILTACAGGENNSKDENYFILLKDKETISLNTYENSKIKEHKTFGISEKSIYATDQKQRVIILDTAKNLIDLYDIQTSKEMKLSIPYNILPKSILINNDNLFIGGIFGRGITDEFCRVMLIQYQIQSGKWYQLEIPKEIYNYWGKAIDDLAVNDSLLIAIDNEVLPKYVLFYRLNATDKLVFSHFKELKNNGANEDIRQCRITPEYFGLMSYAITLRGNCEYIAIYNDLDLKNCFAISIEEAWQNQQPAINDFLLTGNKLIFAHKEKGLGVLEIKDSCFKIKPPEYYVDGHPFYEDDLTIKVDTDKINYIPFKNEEIIHLTLIPDDTKIILTIRNAHGEIRNEINEFNDK